MSHDLSQTFRIGSLGGIQIKDKLILEGFKYIAVGTLKMVLFKTIFFKSQPACFYLTIMCIVQIAHIFQCLLIGYSY